jgi:hypothetical protein
MVDDRAIKEMKKLHVRYCEYREDCIKDEFDYKVWDQCAWGVAICIRLAEGKITQIHLPKSRRF